MPDSPLRASIVLCDFAAAEGGKMNIMGGGWTRIVAAMPVHIALAVLVYVPYDQLNQQRKVAIRIMDEDGNPYPKNDPVLIEADLEVGRPPGMRPGEETVVPIPLKLNGIQFKTGGYRAEVAVDGVRVATQSFTALKNIAIPGG